MDPTSLAQHAAGARADPFASIPEFDWQRWRRDCIDILDNITSPGNYSSFKKHTVHANPGLELQGNITIPLPLRPEDAERIRNVCRQAPFGKGDETLVDTSVRKTWELDATQFKTRNPLWNSFVQNYMFEPALKDLGIVSATAQPYKLLLYEEGSFFKAHKDSEKIPGMFGTLVVCLPSKHSGGGVKLSFGDSDQTYWTEIGSEFNMSSLAWYSDVTHEITEVKSGYRLVLTYNIVQTASTVSGCSAKQSVAQVNQLRQHLAKWRSNPSDVAKLVCCNLDHQYTESSFQALRTYSLKGRDNAVYQTFRKAAEAEGFYLFIGNMSHHKFEDFGGEDRTELHHLYDFLGGRMAGKADVTLEELLDEEQYLEREPDEREEGEFTGNASMPDMCRYHDTVLVVVPKHEIGHLLEFAPMDTVVSVALADLARDDGIADKYKREAALKIMKMALSDQKVNQTLPRGWHRRNMKQTRPHLTIPLIVEWAHRLKEDDLFHKATALWATCDNVAEAIHTVFSASECYRSIMGDEKNLGDDDEGLLIPTVDWDYWFRGVMSASSGTDALSFFLTTFEDRLCHEGVKVSFRSWKSTVLYEKLDATTVWDDKSRELAVTILLERHADAAWLQEQFLPYMCERGTKSFLRGALVRIAQRGDETLDKTAIFTHVLELCSPTLVLDLEDLTTQPSASGDALTNAAQLSVVNDGKDAPCRVFALLVAIIIDLRLHCYLDGLFDLSRHALDHATTKPVAPTEAAFCLQTIIESMAAHGIEGSPECTCFAEIMLRKFVLAGIPPCPSKEAGWAYKRLGCHCADCQRLDEYLLSRTEQHGFFQMGEPRRNHLQERLSKDSRLRCGLDRTRSGGYGAYTLVVTKMVKAYDADLTFYRTAKAEVEQRVLPLRGDYLRRMLGTDTYDKYVMMGHIQAKEDKVIAADADAIEQREQKARADEAAEAEERARRTAAWARGTRGPLHATRPVNNQPVPWKGSSVGVKRSLDTEAAGPSGRNKKTAITLD